MKKIGVRMFNILKRQKYLKIIRKNLEMKERPLIDAFKNLETLRFPADARVLMAISSMDDSEECGVYLAVNEDLFDGVDQVGEDSPYTDGVILIENFLLYPMPDDSKAYDAFIDFYEASHLEEHIMKEISCWVKKCFDRAQITLPLPIYFSFTDEDDALNLVTGKWQDQMEIEL